MSKIIEGSYLEDEEGKCYLGPAIRSEFPKDGSTSHEQREKHKWILETIMPKAKGKITCDDYGFVHGQNGVIARLKIIHHH